MSNSNNIHFCNECNNLTFLHINEEKELIHYCKSCEKIEKYQGDGCIFFQDFKDLDKSKIINSNKYINHDITLPFITGNLEINCPNTDCDTNTSSHEKKIKYLKHDYENMKYTYICDCCGQKWTN